ncbi:MAG: hypothetical protein HY347_03305 [candidate division NC10 bacterium]|nr:hypothetical protein [candidate division NC10 bacterium]
MEGEVVVWMSERLRSEIHEMCQKTLEMLRLTWEGFRKQETGPLQPAEQLGQEIHQREKTLTAVIVTRPSGPVGALGENQELFFIPLHLERIGDHIELKQEMSPARIAELNETNVIARDR